MRKFFVETNQIEDSKITIKGSDVQHINNVLRMKKGDKLQINDKITLESYVTQIYEIQKDIIILDIIEKVQENKESNVHIDLYQGLPKADKMEWIIQKTTELGVDKIIPVDMLRCIVKLQTKEENKKIQRWQKVAEGAAKQSKRDKVPQIENKIKLKEIVNKISEYDLFLVAYEEEQNNSLKKQIKTISQKQDYKIGILIGPEGGLDIKEVEMLKMKGANIITLGKRILRTETAPIVMISNILYELEE